MPLIFANELQDTILLPRFIFLTLVTFISTVYFLFKKKKTRLFIHHPIVYIFFGFVLLSALSCYSSINKAESVFETGKMALYFIAFIFLTQLFLQESKSFLVFAKCIVTSVIIHGLLMISEFFIDNIDLSNYKSLCEFSSLMGNKNIFCEYMLCCLPFCIYCFWIGNRIWKALSFSGIFLIVASSVFLQTRSVWVAAFIVLLVFLSLLISQSNNLSFSLHTISKKIFIVFTPAVLLLFILFTINPSVKNSVVERIKSTTQISKNGSAKGRLVLWEKSLKLVKEHPYTGVGAGNWKIAFQKYGQEHPSKVFNVRVMNDFVLVLCETGMPGFIFFAGLFLYCIILLIKLFAKSGNDLIKRQALAVLTSLMLYMVTSFFSFPKERPDSLMILTALLAISVALHVREERKNPIPVSKQGLVPIPILFILIFIAFIFSKRVKGEFFLQKALKARTENKHSEVISAITNAENYFYTIDGSSTPLSWYKGVARFQLNDSLALADFEKSYTFNPYHLHVLNNLATVLDHEGYQEKAIRYYKEAIAVSPRFLPAIINLTVLYYNQGNLVEAERTIKLWKGKRLAPVINFKKMIHDKIQQAP